MIISVKEARKLLGKGSRDLSDEQIEKLVNDLDGIASAYIRAVMSGEIDLKKLQSAQSHEK